MTHQQYISFSAQFSEAIIQPVSSIRCSAQCHDSYELYITHKTQMTYTNLMTSAHIQYHNIQVFKWYRWTLHQACQTCGPLQAHQRLDAQRILIGSFNDQNCSCGPHDNTYLTLVGPSVWPACSTLLLKVNQVTDWVVLHWSLPLFRQLSHSRLWRQSNAPYTFTHTHVCLCTHWLASSAIYWLLLLSPST